MSRMHNGNYLIDRYGLRAAPREPVSTFIGLSGLLASVPAALGVGHVAAFAIGSSIGGAIVMSSRRAEGAALCDVPQDDR